MVWQRSRDLAKDIYQLTKFDDLQKDFGLKQQILNSSGSIPDNIAEGFERNGNKEFRQFLSVAKGSAGELRSQIYRLFDREVLNQNEFNYYIEAVTEISKMLSSLIKRISDSAYKGSKFV